MDEADWDRVVDVDLKGTFLCSRYALEAMVARRSGNIINIASVHTVATLPAAAPYAASKGGVDMMTRFDGDRIRPLRHSRQRRQSRA